LLITAATCHGQRREIKDRKKKKRDDAFYERGSTFAANPTNATQKCESKKEAPVAPNEG